MKKITILIVLLTTTISFSQTTFVWRAEANNGNWSVQNNWWNGSSTQTPNGNEIIRFDNNNRTTMANNLNSNNSSRFRIFFDPTASTSRIINGTNENTFFDFSGNKPKIENSSSATHTINFPIKLGNFTTEINPVNGDLTLGGTVNLQSNFLDVFGNNGKTLTFNGIISGTGGLTIKENSIVIMNADNTYTGDTTISAGTLRVGTGIGTGSIGGNITNNGAFIINRPGNLTYNGVISGTGTWTKQGSSTLTLSQDQTFSGTATINAGVLRLEKNIQNSDVTVNNGAALIIVGDDVKLKSLTVNTGGVVIINPGKALTITGNLSVNGTGNFTLESTSITYSSLIVNGTVTGDVKYKRHVNLNSSTGGNDLISAPVSGQTFGAFVLANPTNIVTDPNNSNRKLFGPFNKTTGDFQIYDTSVNSSVPLSAGIGYRAASTDNGTFTFSGTVNIGTVTSSILNSGPAFAQWNLIGNPYPSYMSVQDFLNPSNISQFASNYVAIYGYDNDSSDGNNYTILNLANTTSSTVITPGQGFFVASKVGGGSVDFNASMRRIGTTDDFILLRGSNNAAFQLKSTNGTQNYITDFYFNDDSTLGLDPGYDAGIFGTSAPAFSIYSHLVEDNIGVNMAIQSLPYSALDTEVIVPLGINAVQGQQVTISINNTTLPSNVNVYLEDNVATTSTLLNSGSYVHNTTSNLSGTGRFSLRFTNTTLSTESSELEGLRIFSTNAPKLIHVKGQLNNATSLNLYDIQGRMVINSILNPYSNSNTVDVSNVSAGVYVVKLFNNSQEKIQKIIIR